MLGSASKVIRVYCVTISSLDGKFQLEAEVKKVDRGVLLSLENPKYGKVLEKCPHLEGLHMDNGDKKPELPVHLIPSASEYAKIKTETSLQRTI